VSRGYYGFRNRRVLALLAAIEFCRRSKGNKISTYCSVKFSGIERDRGTELILCISHADFDTSTISHIRKSEDSH
jgi:hypothetical protein